MRAVLHSQMSLGEEDIAKIKLNPKSRDDIPQLLAGLQSIYTAIEVRQSIFSILEEVIPPRVVRVRPERPVKTRADREWNSGEYWSGVSFAWD